MNKYGKFSRDYKEFIITRPDTPTPWVNYLTNGTYNALITNTAGGFSFYVSPRDSRITRWRYNSMPIDRPGRYIYIRNTKTGKYFSPTWQPTFTKVKNYNGVGGKFSFDANRDAEQKGRVLIIKNGKFTVYSE